MAYELDALEMVRESMPICKTIGETAQTVLQMKIEYIDTL